MSQIANKLDECIKVIRNSNDALHVVTHVSFLFVCHFFHFFPDFPFAIFTVIPLSAGIAFFACFLVAMPQLILLLKNLHSFQLIILNQRLSTITLHN